MPDESIGQPRRLSVVDEPAYYEALGRFVTEFAAVEAAMFMALKFYAKVSWPMARVLFSGTRVRAAIDLINRTCEISDPGEDRRAELREVFKRLRAINEIRDSLLHHGSVTYSDRGRTTSNVLISHAPRSLKESPVSLEILDAMTADLRKIGYHLNMQVISPTASFAERAAEIRELTDAWQYTPPGQPDAPARTHRQSPRRDEPDR